METIKCVVVGDSAVGKTYLIRAYTTDCHGVHVMIDGKLMYLGVWDTSGKEDYDRVRPICYPQTDVFIICYSIIAQSSLENVKAKWYPEIKHHAPGVPIILIGTKSDLQDEKAGITADIVSDEAANVVGKEIGAKNVLKCSAVTPEVNELFDEAARVGLEKARKRNSGGCMIL